MGKNDKKRGGIKRKIEGEKEKKINGKHWKPT